MQPKDAPLTELLQLAAQGERTALDRVFSFLHFRQHAHGESDAPAVRRGHSTR